MRPNVRGFPQSVRHAHRGHERSEHSGVTLVELLVVLAILGVLLAILLPATARVRAEGRKVACKAQLHDLGAAFGLYLNQYNNRYPPARYFAAFDPPPPAGPMPTIEHFLLPILRVGSPDDPAVTDTTGGVGRVFVCPADDTYAREYRLSYSYYQELGERRLSQTFFYRVMRSASRVPVLWDADNFHGGDVPFNWLMADGHVEQFLKDAPTDRVALEAAHGRVSEADLADPGG